MNLRKLIAFALMIAMLVTLAASCSDDEATTTTTTTESAATEQKTEEVEETIPAETEDTTTYTVSLHVGDNQDLPYNERYFGELLEDKFNIELELVVLMEERLQLALNTGDVPDLMGLWKGQAIDYRNLFIDIENYTDQLPNVMAMISKYESQLHLAQDSDGHLLFIPSVVTNNLPMIGWMTNKTILDDMNVSIPDTTEDFYLASKAFKEYKPEGYALSGGLSFDMFVAMFLNETDFLFDEDRFEYKWLRPEAYDFLEYANRFYEEGLLHPEYLTDGDNNTQSDVILGNRLFYAFWQMTSWGPGGNLDDPEFEDEIIGLIPPKTPWGTRSSNAIPGNIVGNGHLINKLVEEKPGKLNRILSMYDYMYSENGIIANQWGIDGETYTLDDDGNRIFTEAHINYKADPENSPYNPEFYDMAGFTPVMDNWLGMVPSRFMDYFEQYSAIPDSEYIRSFKTPPAPMNDEDTNTVNEIVRACEDYVMQHVHAIIMGRTALDEWDRIVNSLINMNAERIGELKTAAYEEWKSSQN